MEEIFLLREVINKRLVTNIANDIKKVWKMFDQNGFKNQIIPYLKDLSFSDRSLLITENLYKYLPKNYSDAIKIMLRSFGPELSSKELGGFDIFYYMPHGSYVAKYGLSKENFEISMRALYEITKRFSSESPIRPFLIKFPEQTLAQLKIWAKDENLHVRRLVSEGTRPRLPLAQRLPQFQKNPTPVIELLEQLKTDPELYVRRSVANNFNDIGKDNPDLVVKVFKRWQKINNKDTLWIIKHALRSLVKQGNKEALAILGFKSEPKIEILSFKLISDQIRVGQYLEFNFQILSTSSVSQKLMIDFVIYYMKANGNMAPKVFKLSQKEISAAETIQIKKRHSFKKISTRKYYYGQHKIQLQINGSKFNTKSFNLIDDKNKPI